MTSEDIVKILLANLPDLTNRFSAQIEVSSITSSGLIATATTSSEHALVDGEIVTIVGANTPIDIVRLIRNGDVADVETLTDHDFSITKRDRARGVKISALITGSNEAEFNGEFQIIETLDRRNFQIKVQNSGANQATGSSLLQNGSNYLSGYNGAFNITVISPTKFTYDLLFDPPNDATGSPIVHSGHRITAAINVDRFMQSYTQQEISSLYCVVILGDVIASKGRNNRSDSTERFNDNQAYRQEVTQSFGIYIVFPASSSIAGRSERDEAESIVPLIFKSILLADLPTGFASAKQGRVTFNAHGNFLYDGPRYVHEITFEQNADILYEDTVGDGQSVALRDIELLIDVASGAPKDAS